MRFVFIKREELGERIHPRDQRMNGPGVTWKGVTLGREGVGGNDTALDKTCWSSKWGERW